MTDFPAIAGSSSSSNLEIRKDSYVAMVARRRLYSGLALLIFVLLMVSGFWVADDRNAGGFWEGLHQIGDYPGEVLAEAWKSGRTCPD